MALALLPADFIVPAWQELKEEVIVSLSPGDKRQLADFRRYVDSYWIRQVGPAILSVAFAPRRTNNEVECHNRQLNQKARVAHPAPFMLAKVIGQELTTTELNIQAMNNGNPVRTDSRAMFARKEAQLRRWQQAVQRGSMHFTDFLARAASLNKKYYLQTQRYMERHARRLGENFSPQQQAEEEGTESGDGQESSLEDGVEEVVPSSDEENYEAR